MTSYKKQILAFLAQKRHARVEEIFNTLKSKESLISIATIYRNLKSLEKGGEVLGFLHPDGAVRYELASQDSHQHLVCEECGAITEVKLGFVGELSKSLQERAQFSLHIHRLSMIGRCSQCNVAT